MWRGLANPLLNATLVWRGHAIPLLYANFQARCRKDMRFPSSMPLSDLVRPRFGLGVSIWHLTGTNDLILVVPR